MPKEEEIKLPSLDELFTTQEERDDAKLKNYRCDQEILLQLQNEKQPHLRMRFFIAACAV